MTRRTVVLLMLLLMLAGAVACERVRRSAGGGARPAQTVDLSKFFERDWATDPVWDDGQAEVATYAARRMQYGKLREFDAVFITVKEDFNRKYYVKANPPYEGKSLLPVLKLNIAQTYQTENYPYHFLTSVFVLRADATTLVKLTSASQEWCGNTFKEIRNWGETPELAFHSYWDGQGDGYYPLGLQLGGLLEDQLPLSLRALRFTPGLRFRTRVYPSTINNQAIPGRWQEAEFSVAGEENLATPAGVIPSWKVVMKTATGETLFWYEKAAPNIMVKLAAPDAREFLLKSRERRQYWTLPK